jgi:hypothetical protein
MDQITAVFHHSVFAIGDRSGDLFHPEAVRRLRNAAKLNAPRGKFDEEEDHEPLKPSLRPNLDREEVGGHDLIPMAIEEFFPCGLGFSFGCGLNAATSKDIRDRGCGDSMADVLQCALDTDLEGPCALTVRQFDEA